jgi:hypothetical protein
VGRALVLSSPVSSFSPSLSLSPSVYVCVRVCCVCCAHVCRVTFECVLCFGCGARTGFVFSLLLFLYLSPSVYVCVRVLCLLCIHHLFYIFVVFVHTHPVSCSLTETQTERPAQCHRTEYTPPQSLFFCLTQANTGCAEHQQNQNGPHGRRRLPVHTANA